MLIPVALIAGGYWRLFFSASVTTLLLVGVSLLLWGAGPWADFLTEGQRQAGMLLYHYKGLILWLTMSPFAILTTSSLSIGWTRPPKIRNTVF